MNQPLHRSAFAVARPCAERTDGLDPAIDEAAAAAAASHRFLRRGWFAAAAAAYGGAPRTLAVRVGGAAVIALPFACFGPPLLRLATVPGCYWPFRSFPAAPDAGEPAWDMLLDTLGREVRALRIGPVHDDDPSLAALRAAAARRGWAALDRFVAESWRLDLTNPAWPRGSTLKKNRFHEKHLAAHGALAWRFLDGAALAAGGFDALAAVEERSWIASRTDGRDAKFTAAGHGAFWRGAAADPVVARMLSAALLTIDGRPAAFSFDLDAGPLRYAVANSYVPEFGKHSPGKLLHYRNLLAAREHGITTVDWGAGDGGYKQVIGASCGPAIRDWLLLAPGTAALAAPLRGWWRRSGHRPAAGANTGSLLPHPRYIAG